MIDLFISKDSSSFTKEMLIQADYIGIFFRNIIYMFIWVMTLRKKPFQICIRLEF